MKLQTQIKLKNQDNNQIDYESKLLLLGSCFSENIGSKFQYYKFQSISNPFGILFHPKAIERILERAIHNKKFDESDVFFNNEQWHSFDVHSQLSNPSKKQLLINLNKNLELINKQITNATHVVITLGTAWVYNLISTGNTVANCHKIPQKEYNKILLSTKDVVKGLQATLNSIKTINSNASIIFTVSPVRHIKDGFVDNTLSKAHLISAIHQLTNKDTFYFPSFEIMLDELRDYRFYNSDMLHPNNTAIEYIWEKFIDVWMSSETKNIMKEVEVIQMGMQHRPFNFESNAHQKFLENLEINKLKLQKKQPNIIF
ncbi:MAG: GSCFA domain-containing protein [Lacinutrix sp.]|uniref:GSCFA domain-containing protein n=1 Tax=Lacinutrix sp. TaxID=1937692 RepID=UPI0030AB0376